MKIRNLILLLSMSFLCALAIQSFNQTHSVHTLSPELAVKAPIKENTEESKNLQIIDKDSPVMN